MAKRGKVRKKKKREVIERPVRYRKYQQFFLIVCEDENTEPAYFDEFKKLFPEYTMYLKAVGTGRDPLGVVKSSISERDRLKAEANKEIDFVWAVFDKDDADENETKTLKFKEAFTVSSTENINLAYSNEVFELWFLLHLADVDGTRPIPRKQIYETLEKLVRESGNRYENYVYEHGNSDIVQIVADIGDEKRAVERADDLIERHVDKKPIDANPSTKVHVLVKELRDWIYYYNWEPE